MMRKPTVQQQRRREQRRQQRQQQPSYYSTSSVRLRIRTKQLVALVVLVVLSSSFVIASSSKSKDLYSTLSIPKNASSKEITKAYRKLALKYHPDKVKPEEREEAEKKFKEIGYAHDVLSDEEKRKRYDLYGDCDVNNVNVGNMNMNSGTFNGAFNGFSGFGGMGGNSRTTFYSNGMGMGMGTGGGVQIDLNEILQEFMMGSNSSRSRSRKPQSGLGSDAFSFGSSGGGFGGYGGFDHPMGSSMGMGMGRQRQQQRPRYYNHSSKPKVQQFYCSLTELSNVNGCTKKIKVQINNNNDDDVVDANDINGVGKKLLEKEYIINVQPGWKDGTKINFKASQDGMFPPMTFILRERKHKYLVRDGDNLVFHCTVTGRQATKGAKIKVPLPNGEVLEIETTPNEITKGYVKEIIGKGMPRKKKAENNYSDRGDLVIEFRIKEES